jgi:hypothetical protein
LTTCTGASSTFDPAIPILKTPPGMSTMPFCGADRLPAQAGSPAGRLRPLSELPVSITATDANIAKGAMLTNMKGIRFRIIQNRF